jgi:RND family efflux transporter MFP subunit
MTTLATALPLAAAEQPPAEPVLEFDCVVTPQLVVDLSSAVPGRIARVLVGRGDPVVAGQVLAELEASVEAAGLAIARARAERDAEVRLRRASLEFEERRGERTEALFRQRVVSDHAREEVERDRELSTWQLRDAQEKQELAALEVERAEALLRLRSIESPVTGVVVQRLKSAGEYVEEQAILRIAQLDPLRVEAILPMDLYGVVRKGMTALVTPESVSPVPRKARVVVVDSIGDAASGTFGVALDMPNPDRALPAGLKCRVRFDPHSVPEPEPAAPAQETAEPDRSAPPANRVDTVAPAGGKATVLPEKASKGSKATREAARATAVKAGSGASKSASGKKTSRPAKGGTRRPGSSARSKTTPRFGDPRVAAHASGARSAAGSGWSP